MVQSGILKRVHPTLYSVVLYKVLCQTIQLTHRGFGDTHDSNDNT